MPQPQWPGWVLSWAPPLVPPGELLEPLSPAQTSPVGLLDHRMGVRGQACSPLALWPSRGSLMMCITRVSRCGAGDGRTMGIWEGSVCLLHAGVPTASTGEPQTRSHPQGDTLRFHSPLQPGVWGSTTMSPKFTFEAKHKCLCGQKAAPGSVPRIHSRVPTRWPALRLACHPAPSAETWKPHVEGHAWRLQLEGASRGLVFLSPGALFLLRRRQTLYWRGSFSLAFPLPRPLPSSFFCQRLH